MSRELKCVDKMSFDSKQEAESTATVTEYQRGSKLKAYRCNDCGLWHLSSNFGDKDDD